MNTPAPANLTNRELLVGVGGGVAAYKTAMLVSSLVQQGARVTVVLTKAGAQFVQAPTFAALTGRPVVQDLFDPRFPLGAHIELARRADLICVVPTTADLIGKIAGGLADDLLTTTLLAFSGPVLLAPAMNAEMWRKPSVQRNVELLKSDGLHFIGPDDGWLSCRDQGPGRMSSPADIEAAIGNVLQQHSPE